jgi:hypothetical protein
MRDSEGCATIDKNRHSSQNAQESAVVKALGMTWKERIMLVRLHFPMVASQTGLSWPAVVQGASGWGV